jgi:hypothetical protein
VTFSSVLRSSLLPSSPFASPFIWAWHTTYYPHALDHPEHVAAPTGFLLSFMHRCPVHDSDISRSLDCCHLGSSHQPSFFRSMGLFATSHTSLLFSQGVIATIASTRVPQQKSQPLPLNATIRRYIPSYSSPVRYHPSLQLLQLPPVATSLCDVLIFCPGLSRLYRTLLRHRINDLPPYLCLPFVIGAFTTFPSSYHATFDFALSLPPSSLWGPPFFPNQLIHCHGAIHLECASTYAFKPSFGITPPTTHSGYHPLPYLG